MRAVTLSAIAALSALLVGIFTAPLLRAGLPTLETIAVDPAQIAHVSVDGFDQEQLHNAATILAAGADLGLGARDQAIGVMTAIGESSLRNIAFGDWESSGQRNPDGSPTSSIGLFQQQEWWAARDVRLDPYASARLFFAAMTRAVPDAERAGLAPTLVAHRTQRNKDPYHYERFWDDAVRIVTAFAQDADGPPQADA